MSWVGRKLCRFGYHSWRFVRMSDLRMITVPPYSDYICTRVDRCIRCDLHWTRENTSLPKRVKT